MFVGAVLLAFGFGGAAMADDGGKLAKTISVTATGSAEAEPDKASFSVGVVSVAATADAALSENNAAIAEVLDGLKAAGVPAGNLSTQQVSLSPNFERPKSRGGEPEITGYTVRNMVQAEIDDVSQLGKLLDTATRLGANQFGGISFGVSEPGPKLDEARRAAVKEARRLADLYAAAAGVEIAGVVSLREGGGTGGPPVMVQRSAAASSVPIEPGTATLSVTLHAVFAIE